MKVSKRKYTKKLDVYDQLEIANGFVIGVLELSREAQAHYLYGLKYDKSVDDKVAPIIRNLKTMQNTLEVFCEKIGMDPLDLLSTHRCGIREWEYVEDMYWDDPVGIDAGWFRSLMDYVRG
jgi:hypothetical protein